MEAYDWFHGNITKEEAASKLAKGERFISQYKGVICGILVQLSYKMQGLTHCVLTSLAV